MRNVTRNLSQTATYWPPGEDNGLGDITFPGPILVRCRWQSKRELIRDDEGNERPSRAEVYVDQGLNVNGWLALGDHTGEADPRNVAGAYPVMQSGFSPSLDGRRRLDKVWL